MFPLPIPSSIFETNAVFTDRKGTRFAWYLLRGGTDLERGQRDLFCGKCQSVAMVVCSNNVKVSTEEQDTAQ